MTIDINPNRIDSFFEWANSHIADHCPAHYRDVLATFGFGFEADPGYTVEKNDQPGRSKYKGLGFEPYITPIWHHAVLLQPMSSIKLFRNHVDGARNSGTECPLDNSQFFDVYNVDVMIDPEPDPETKITVWIGYAPYLEAPFAAGNRQPNGTSRFPASVRFSGDLFVSPHKNDKTGPLHIPSNQPFCLGIDSPTELPIDTRILAMLKGVFYRPVQ